MSSVFFNFYATSEVKPFAVWQRPHFAAFPTVSLRPTHLVFLRISSTSCLMWSSMNSIFSCLRASAFWRRTIRSTSTVLSTSGKLSTTITDGPDWLSGERSSTLLLPPWRAFREPGIRRRREFRRFSLAYFPVSISSFNNRNLTFIKLRHLCLYETPNYTMWILMKNIDIILLLCVLNTNQIQEQYLRNLNDCPCCHHPCRSLHSQPVPASYGLQMKKKSRKVNCWHKTDTKEKH